MMRRVIRAGLAAFAMASTLGAASAADLARPMPASAPMYIPPYNWTGYYLGLNGGGGWGGSQWSSPFGTSGAYDLAGGVVGGTFGYNWQFYQFVFGIEGDVDWSNIRGSGAGRGCVVTNCETGNNWLATARGRIGYAFDRFMPYVTGGLAVGDIKATAVRLGSTDTTNTGWTVGGGVEVGLVGPWTAKVEYLYTDLGNAGCDLTICGAGSNVNFHTSLVRGGINYRF